MCIDLCCLDIRVSEHFLNCSEICASLQQMGRVAVPQLMGGDMSLKSELCTFIPQQFFNRFSGNLPTEPVNEK